MESRRPALAALLVALVAGCAHSGQSASERQAGPASRVVSLENFDGALLASAILEETNRVREANGVAALSHSTQLDAAADEQAMHMALVLRGEHANPIASEHTVVERVENTGFRAELVAENLIMEPARRPVGSPERDYTYSALAAFLVEGWMNSPGHRANLLDPRFTDLGCAARFAHGTPGDERVFAAQVFGLPEAPPVHR